jgi:hypothetical protein
LLASLLPLALVALHPVHAAAATDRTLTIAPAVAAAPVNCSNGKSGVTEPHFQV